MRRCCVCSTTPPSAALAAVATSPPCAALATHVRAQYFAGEQRATAHRSRTSYLHPLAPKDPATRNVALPESALKGKGIVLSQDKQPAEFAKKRAQMVFLAQLQQDVLWEGTVLDEPSHKLVQHFMKLGANPKYRDTRRMMMVGGREMIRELCEGGHVPHHLLVTEGKAIPDWAKSRQSRQKMDIVLVDRKLAEEFAPGNDGYIGDFTIPPPPMKEQLIANKQRLSRILVLDNVDDAGVLGTVLRTATGFQYDAIIATNHCADLYDHRVIRAARGAHFQSGVPIYSLKEEDGDDVYGMLNHAIARNNLQPVCYTPIDDNITDSNKDDVSLSRVPTVFTSSVVGAKPVTISARAPTGTIAAATPGEEEQHRQRRAKLSDFCLEQFTLHAGRQTPMPSSSSSLGGRSSSSSSALDSPGYILFAGPNHKRNLVRKLSQRITRPPTQLLLDSMPSEPDLLLSLSVVLHALRPAGDWDYLPLHERSEPSTMALQTRTAGVEIGANRLIVGEKSLSLDEDEQREAAHLTNDMRKWRRLRRMQKTDYNFWVEAEEAKVRGMQRNEEIRRMTPWDTRSLMRGRALAPASEGGMPNWVPNIIDEYRQPLDRDRLRHERDISESYVRPDNYTR